MTRSSPGVRRVAAILNFMADHPGRSFGLTDIVRALKLSRATCHAVLTGLVEVGYLYRTSDKTYVLGPALAAIGRTAAAHLAPLQVAQPEMRDLADEHDLICTAYFLERDSIVVRERAASASHVGYLGPVGTRLRLSPHIAAVFLAWSSEKELDKWFDAREPLSQEDRDELTRGLAFARDRGFIAIARRFRKPEPEADQAFGIEAAQHSVTVAAELEPGESYQVGALVAPVFAAQGKVAFAIGLAGFDQSTEGVRILRIADQLTGACDRITRFIAGERPSDNGGAQAA